MAQATNIFSTDLLRNKVALVTGGGSGICFEVAAAFGRHGAKLAIMGRNVERLEQAAELLRKQGAEVLVTPGDVRKKESAEEVVKKVVDKYGRLDILVNGAAGNFLCSAADLSVNAFKTVIDIDLNGTFNMCKAAYPALKQSGDALILNISATLHYYAIKYQIHSSAAKAGVDVLTRNLAVEWADDHIRVNGIAPGAIDGTEGFSRLSPPDTKNQGPGKFHIPLGRLGTKNDIAQAGLFFASPAASYITGTTLVVDGGAWLSHSWLTNEQYEMVKEMRKTNSKL
eukprot:TRINITY_DN3280_c0_g1_i1.p1 TRINITY_DN3280_c0_g1~~TRINITY_DN3280_c0_g1_i1.p1  ORF type:complete len:292 (-),score=85.11 TRINITY_DN3280_c0_g1_i1:46-897(-)